MAQGRHLILFALLFCGRLERLSCLGVEILLLPFLARLVHYDSYHTPSKTNSTRSVKHAVSHTPGSTKKVRNCVCDGTRGCPNVKCGPP